MHLVTDSSKKIPHPKNSVFITGVNHFIGIHLAQKFIQNNIHVYGISHILSPETKPPLPLTDLAHLTLLHNSSPTLPPQIFTTPVYLILTDIYAASFSAISLTQEKINLILQHQLYYLNTFAPQNLRITIILPYFNSTSSESQFPFKNFNLPLLVSQITMAKTEYKKNLRIVFLKDCYGPNFDTSSPNTLAQIIRSIQVGKSGQIYSSNQNHISPLFVTDAVEGIFKATLSPNTQNQQFILSGNQTYSTSSLLQQVQQTIPQIGSFTIKDSPNLEPSLEKEVSYKTKKILHWQPEIQFPQGITATANWLHPGLLARKLSYQFPQLYKIKLPTAVQLQPAPLTLIQNLINFPKPVTLLKKVFKQLKRKAHFSPRFTLFLKPALVVAILVIVILPFIFTGMTAFRGIFSFSQSYQHLQNGKLQLAKKEAQFASQQFNMLNNTLNKINLIKHFPGFEPHFIQIQEQLDLATVASQTLAQSSYSLQLLQETIKSTLDPSVQYDSRIPLSQAKLNLDKTARTLGVLQSLLPSEPPFLLAKLIEVGEYHRLQQVLPLVRENLQTGLASFDVYQYFIGYSQPQTYLVVFQNNRELRPTGGFIGSLALVTFQQGKLTNWKIHDVYEADGQLKGHVEPPAPIKQHLGESSWFLRDSNWDPDFPSSAKKIQWFAQKELDTQIAGVIALDVDFISQLVSAMGSVYLADLQTTITPENFYLKTQQNAENDHFAGSHQKGDYLSSIADAILYQIKHESDLNWLPLARTMYGSLFQKNILIYFSDSQPQKIVQQLSWSGSINALQSRGLHNSVLGTSNTTVNDQLFVVEANVGVNKANQYLERQFRHTVDLTSINAISEQLNIVYKNKSQPNSEFGGDYKNYLRLYLPLGSQIKNIKVGQIHRSDLNNTQILSLDLDSIDQSVEHNFQVYGFLVTVPQQSEYLVQADYELASASMPNWSRLLNDKTDIPANYNLQLIKQPGTSVDPYQLTIKFLPDYQPTNTQITTSNQLINYQQSADSQPRLTSDHTLQYNLNLSQDQTINVSFMKDKIKSL